MKKIKYRAWEKESKKWLTQSVSVYLANDGYAFVINGGKIEKIEVEICMFTGLLDRNGKEIYEGDLIQQHQGKDYSIQYYVGWRESRCGFWLYDLDKTPHLDLTDFRENLKVIGNIFENPEMMTTEG